MASNILKLVPLSLHPSFIIYHLLQSSSVINYLIHKHPASVILGSSCNHRWLMIIMISIYQMSFIISHHLSYETDECSLIINQLLFLFFNQHMLSIMHYYSSFKYQALSFSLFFSLSLSLFTLFVPFLFLLFLFLVGESVNFPSLLLLQFQSFFFLARVFKLHS